MLYIYASFLFLIRFPLFSSISYKKNCFNPSYFISDAIFIPLVDKFKKVYLTSRLSQSARHTSFLSVDKIFILLVDQSGNYIFALTSMSKRPACLSLPNMFYFRYDSPSSRRLIQKIYFNRIYLKGTRHVLCLSVIFYIQSDLYPSRQLV